MTGLLIALFVLACCAAGWALADHQARRADARRTLEAGPYRPYASVILDRPPGELWIVEEPCATCGHTATTGGVPVLGSLISEGVACLWCRELANLRHHRWQEYSRRGIPLKARHGMKPTS